VTRILSAVVLIATIGVVLLLAPWWASLALTAVIAAVAAWEMGRLAAAVGAAVSTPVLVTGAVAVCIATAMTPDLLRGGALTQVLLALIVGAGVVTLGAGEPSPAAMTRAGWLLMVPVYVGMPLGVLAWLQIVHGPMVLLLLLGVIAGSDSAQYAAGRLLGRRRLAPAISPGKTIEGAAGGVLAAAAIGALLGPRLIGGATVLDGTVLGVILAAFGIAGDLFESLLKRSAGVKDSSALIPGHGGVLDRIDAYLFAAPVFALGLGYLL
jgi:phosphatidate cytidylyltransferase